MSVIIHIGSSKALSTSIQYNIDQLKENFFHFGKHIDLEKFNKRGVGDYYRDEDCKKLTEVLVNLDVYKGLDAKLKENIQKKVNLAKSQNKVFFYSCELFCESPSLYLMLNIFKEIFGEFKIFYVTRNQVDAIESLYNYEGHVASYLNAKENYKFINFKSFFETGKKQRLLTGGHKSHYWTHDFFRIYNYNQTIKIIKSVIPKENIFVYPMEEIVEKKDINHLFQYLYEISNLTTKKLQLATNEKPLNRSNKSRSFFLIYNLISKLNISPKKFNEKVKFFINYKKIFKFFKTKSVVIDKYKKEIEEHYLKDNLELINNYEKIKKYQSYYNFKNISL